MKELSIVVATADSEWEALYVNGKLEWQDHAIDCETLVLILNKYMSDYDSIKFENVWVKQDWIDVVQSFPDDLSEVMFDGNPELFLSWENDL